jgi:Leucine-rich repeat (LRR) protein
MRLLRVLDLESAKGLVNHHLNSIWKLVHLKYLSLRSCAGIYHLPDSLGNLKQLQTLDITGTRIIKLPQAIIKLRKLQYIRAGPYYGILDAYSYNEYVEDNLPKLMRNKLCVWILTLLAFCLSSCSLEIGRSVVDIDDDKFFNRRDVCTYCCCVVFPFIARLADPSGVVVPKGLRKLKDLHTLGTVNIARGKAILQDIRRLTRLHKLAVTGINKKNCQEFCSTLEHLGRLESLSVDSWEEAGLRGCLDGLRSPPKNLQSLKLQGTLGKLPDWVAGLQNLVKLKLSGTRLTEVDGTIQVLGKLPNLAILHLQYESFLTIVPCCSTSCPEASFPSLTVLVVDLLVGSGFSSLEFQEGAAPKLELLCLGNDDVSFSGLSSLRSLKEVMIDERIPSSQLWLKDVRGQLIENPNKPVLKRGMW